jgi:restriction system protein
MALWMVRTGKHGEYEERFLQNNRIYLTWNDVQVDLSDVQNKKELGVLLQRIYPNAPTGRISNNTGQIWPFVKEMKRGDWVLVPSKKKSAVHVAEITGPYTFDAKAQTPYFHYHTVKWVATDIPRSNFDQDILHSIGAIGTICQVQRHDAEARVRAMAQSNWKSTPYKPTAEESWEGSGDAASMDDVIDLEERGRDTISQLISRRFQSHDLTRLVEGVLKAQGYATYRSPPGPDKGIDILAAPEPLGFGQPRICVQVKSGDTPVDTATLNQLIGSMQNVHADQGLLVSWGGFKSSVDKEIPAQFFRVRLWDQKAFIDELLAHYSKLDPDLRAEIPLKQVWTVAFDEEG